MLQGQYKWPVASLGKWTIFIIYKGTEFHSSLIGDLSLARTSISTPPTCMLWLQHEK